MDGAADGWSSEEEREMETRTGKEELWRWREGLGGMLWDMRRLRCAWEEVLHVGYQCDGVEGNGE